jgi:L-fuconolactonase
MFTRRHPPTIMRLDAHQHFWRYDAAEHVWMDERMGAIKRDFLPADLEPLLATTSFDGTIAVQARQNLAETRWLLELADRHDFIRGVVGWVDLRSTALCDQLAGFSRQAKLVGVRHVVHDEPDDSFMLRPDFRRGIAQLIQFALTYDLLLFPKHLPVAVTLVQEFPAQPFVLDHIGKPRIGEALFAPWRDDLVTLAQCPNVYCKLSGLVTETKWRQWAPKDFHRYLDIVIEAFGPERVMIGSDWPVCTLSGDYASTMNVVADYVRQFSADVRDGILGGNGARFYGVNQRRT